MRKVTKLWKTRNGRKIRICDMTDQHLNNTIEMLKRYAMSKYQCAIKDICAAGHLVSPNTVGEDLVDDALNAHLDSRWADFLPSIFDDLMDEHKRRFGEPCFFCGKIYKGTCSCRARFEGPEADYLWK